MPTNGSAGCTRRVTAAPMPPMAVPALATAARKHGVTIHRLRRARARDAGRAGQRRRHREGHHPHPIRAAGGRRVVAAVLLAPRHRAADRPRQRHRVPDHAGAGNHLRCARHRFLLHPPPPRRRLHAGAAQPRHGGVAARSVPLRAHVLADPSASPERVEAVVRQVVPRPDRARHELELRQNRRRSRPNACAIRAGHVAGQRGARVADQLEPRVARTSRSRKPGAAPIDRTPGHHPRDLAGRCACPASSLRPAFSGHGFGIGPAAGQACRRHRDRRDAAGRPRWPTATSA